MIARDIMNKHVVTVRPEMTIRELAQILDDKHITGVPVISDQGNLVGVVSQTDIVRHDREAAPEEHAFHRQPDMEVPKGFHAESPDDTRVEQIMTPWTISYEENTPIEELARQMLRKHIHRVVITRQGKLVGIVTSMDLLRAMLGAYSKKSASRSIR